MLVDFSIQHSVEGSLCSLYLKIYMSEKKLEAILNIKKYQDGFWVPVMFFCGPRDGKQKSIFASEESVHRKEG